MDMDALKPILAGVVRHALTSAGGALVAGGYIQSSDTSALVGGGMVIAGMLWSWWQKDGQAKVSALLQKMTATKTSAQAVKAAEVLPPAAAVDTAAKSASVQSVAKVLLIAFLFSAFLVPAAFAQGLPKIKPLTGNIVNDLGLTSPSSSKATATLDNIAAILAKPFQDIANFIGDDADAAVSLSTVIPALQDGHGQQCWIAMKSFGDIIKAHPVPITFHIINDYETLRLLGIATNNLCSNVHCTQVFADATAMAQAASPMPLLIPSLHDLCTKVPQIAVVPPITVPTPAPTPTPN